MPDNPNPTVLDSIQSVAPAQAPASQLSDVVANPEAVSESTPDAPVKNVEDSTVLFVPFEDFTGRINQEDFNFRKDVPTKVHKSEANVWLEAKKGYIK